MEESTPGVETKATEVQPFTTTEITTVQPFTADADADVDDDGGVNTRKLAAANNENTQGGISAPISGPKGAWGEEVEQDGPR